MRWATLIVVLAGLGLSTLLVLQYRQWDQRIQAAEAEVVRFSNACQAAWAKVAEQDRVLAAFETNLNSRTDELVRASAQLVQAKSDLAQTRTELAQARAELASVQEALRVAQTDLQTKTARLTSLEALAEALGWHMGQLTNTLEGLEAQITDVQGKLARAEGNRDFLLKELKRLQQEKAALLARFNDLAALRAQIARLRAEAAINQRLTWMQQGVYHRREMKGAQGLVTAVSPQPPRGATLNVEMDRSGEARVLPTTNSLGPGP